MSSAVVLSSGGINSAVVLEIALRAHRPDTIHVVSFEYESKYNEQERLASLDLYSYYTDRGENITLEQVEIAGPNVTPFLDGILLSRATAYAITKRTSYIYTDISGHGSVTFLGAMAAAIYIAHHSVQLEYPLAWMTAIDVIKHASELRVPINLTWSCSQPTRHFPYDESKLANSALIHCGLCYSCVARINGFKKLSYVDPVLYAVEIEWDRLSKAWPHTGEKQLRAREL